MSEQVVDFSKNMPIVENNTTSAQLDDMIAAPMERFPDYRWWLCFLAALSLLGFGAFCLTRTFLFGIGEWGNNNPVYWAFDIVNFVFWIGIGHAGTLISAVLFLFRQWWRNSIARAAEAMTVFAVICAMIFPVIHTGRPWLAHYLIPYPSERNLWTNFTSPLEWDVFAVSTYGTVSFVFWYVGLIPDFGVMRDRTKITTFLSKVRKYIYTILSWGWVNSNRHWQHYERTYLILAGFATPLVFSVHTVVSFDFATSVIPGWHTTIFPPYFVAGAVFSGFAMVVSVMTLVRWAYHLEDVITINTLEKVNKILMATGLMVGYAYGMEFFIAWYGQNPNESFVFYNRAFGPNSLGYWAMVSCNVISPQIFWFRKARRSILIMSIVAIFVNIGMWYERYTIIVSSLSRDYLPSSWDRYEFTYIDLGLLLGSFGLFFTLVLLFTRFLPVVAMSEIKAVAENNQPTHHGDDH